MPWSEQETALWFAPQIPSPQTHFSKASFILEPVFRAELHSFSGCGEMYIGRTQAADPYCHPIQRPSLQAPKSAGQQIDNTRTVDRNDCPNNSQL